MNIFKYLKKLVDANGSDLYISVGLVPTIRVEGTTMAISSEVVTDANAREMVEDILSEWQHEEFQRELELNMALHSVDIGRFRVNIFMQRGAYALVARHVVTDIPSMESLGLPYQLKQLINEQRGLVLFVGGTGVGKSTSLASMINYRAQNTTGHILTIEDPIEFLHTHSKSIVNQREVGVDTHSYEAALRNALREAPDVIMIGEIRNSETMRHALNYAETGHLCVATLHANTASQALDRIVNFFPHDAHNRINTDLSLFLKAIVGQNLCHGLDGKRIAIFEIMLNTPYIAELIHEGQYIDIKDAMQRAQDDSHRSFDDDLFDLYFAGRISKDEALRFAVSKNNLYARFQSHMPSSSEGEEKVKEQSRRAAFSKYKSYRVKPPKIENMKERGWVKALNNGILNAFKSKGLKYDKTSPDIDVYYEFRVKNDGALKLEETVDPDHKAAQAAAEARQPLELIMTIRSENKEVWRADTTDIIISDLSDKTISNRHMAKLLTNYPKLQK